MLDIVYNKWYNISEDKEGELFNLYLKQLY